MKVNELTRILQGCNPNDLVIMSDEDGNYYLPCTYVNTDTAYNPDTGESKYRKLTPELKKLGYTDEDVAIGKGFKKSVTLS